MERSIYIKVRIIRCKDRVSRYENRFTVIKNCIFCKKIIIAYTKQLLRNMNIYSQIGSIIIDSILIENILNRLLPVNIDKSIEIYYHLNY